MEVVQERFASQKLQLLLIVAVLVPRRFFDVDIHSRGPKVVNDGVKNVVVLRFFSIEIDAHNGEDGGFFRLPVEHERAVANTEVEVLDACVLQTTEGLGEVPVVS